MNPRLVMCLFASAVIGLLVAGAAVAAGWSVFVALPLYSLTGSVSLIATSVLSIPSEAPEPLRAAVAAADPRIRQEAAHA